MSDDGLNDRWVSQPTRKSEQARLKLAQLTIESGATLSEILRDSCCIAADTLQVPRVGVWLLNEEQTCLRCAALYQTASGEFSQGATLQLTDMPRYFSALQNRKVLPSENAQNDPMTSELLDSYLRPLQITSLLDAPILIAGQVQGVICIEFTGDVTRGMVREWSTEDRDFVASVADLLATKIRAAEVQQLRNLLELSEDRIMKMEKSDALANMAFNIAHDFRNILSAVMNCAETLSLSELSDANRSVVNLITQAAVKGKELVQELADFGKNNPSQPSVLDISEQVESFLPVLKTAIGGRHRIDVQIEKSHGKVFMDRNHFHRVLLNLIMNAKEAMPDGGTIDLRVHVSKSASKEAVNRASIEIRDHGCGMGPDTLARLFEPFFTTKPSGCGLGMPIVHRLVERSGGKIEVESRISNGTTIRILLPLVG